MRSTSFTSIKNTQGKLGNLKEELTLISQDLSAVRETTKVDDNINIGSWTLLEIYAGRPE